MAIIPLCHTENSVLQVDVCTLGNSNNHCDPLSGKVVKICHKYRLDVFSEMKKGRS